MMQKNAFFAFFASVVTRQEENLRDKNSVRKKNLSIRRYNREGRERDRISITTTQGLSFERLEI
jgi:hypothetical protein